MVSSTFMECPSSSHSTGTRAKRIADLPLSYIDNPDFPMFCVLEWEPQICGVAPYPKEETVIEASLESPKEPAQPAFRKIRKRGVLEIPPLLDATTEKHLFRKMNFLKYRASQLRSTLRFDRPSVAVMEQIEYCYDMAVETKNEIVSANIRLVVSVAKKHVSPRTPLYELVSDGCMTLLRAVEKFDYSRGNRFSTYATWALIRSFARSITAESRHQERFQAGQSDWLQLHPDQHDGPVTQENVSEMDSIENRIATLFHHLDEREQWVILHRYGFHLDGRVASFREIGEKLGITKGQARQIGIRALEKLRRMSPSDE